MQDVGSYETNVDGGGKKRKVEIESAEQDGPEQRTAEEWMQYVQELQTERSLVLRDLQEDDEDEEEEDEDAAP
jgi:hypothetical protein